MAAALTGTLLGAAVVTASAGAAGARGEQLRRA